MRLRKLHRLHLAIGMGIVLAMFWVVSSASAASARLDSRPALAGDSSAGPAVRHRSAGHIIYASHGRLISVPARGGNHSRVIARVPGGTLDLAASRTGREIALISSRRAPYPRRNVHSIYLLRRGQDLQLLKRFRTEAGVDIALSPDGRTIAYCHNGEIWLMPAAEKKPSRQITTGPGTARDPAFTSAGRTLVFQRRAGPGAGTRHIARISLPDGTEQPLIAGEARLRAVSSTGLLLYLRSGENPVPSRLVVSRLDGDAPRTVERSREPFFNMDAAFSPDGRSVAYLRLWEKSGYPVDYRYSIHTVSSSGHNNRTILRGIRNTATEAPYGGHGPAGPLWVP